MIKSVPLIMSLKGELWLNLPFLFKLTENGQFKSKMANLSQKSSFLNKILIVIKVVFSRKWSFISIIRAVSDQK